MIRICVIVITFGLFTSCSPNYNRLSKKYKSNEGLYSNIADSLITICKNNNTHITVRNRYDLDAITFGVYVSTINTNVLITFGPNSIREDSDPELTEDIIISKQLVSMVKQGIFRAILADGKSVFLGYEFYRDGNVMYGVLVKNDGILVESDCIKRLSNNTCITRGVIP